MRWLIGALSLLIGLAVLFGASAARSALSGSSASSTLIDGSTDSITNIDPAGTYDYGTFTLNYQVFQHLMNYTNGPKLQPELATKCFAVGSTKTWRCNLRKGVTFQDGSSFDSADVKFSIDRVTNKSILKQAAANSPSPLIGNLKSVKTNGKYAVTFNLKSPQSTWPSILATQCCNIVPSDTYAPDKLMPNTSPADRHRAVQARQVHAGAAGCLPGVLRVLGPEAEDAEPDHQLLLEVVDDEARAAEGRDRHGVPVLHADGAHLAPEAEGAPRLLGRGRAHPLPGRST